MTDQHDPGGKSTFPLPPGVRGEAALSQDGMCRWMLTREWLDNPTGASTWLWIGLNPSTANADVDDPTIRVEWNLTQGSTNGKMAWAKDEARPRYVKMNVLPFRVTDPTNLDRLMLATGTLDKEMRAEQMAGMQAMVAANFLAVLDEAATCDRLVIAFGKPRSKVVAWQCLQLLSMLKNSYPGVIWCVGLLQDNWPAHPLRRKCVLQPYRVTPTLDGKAMDQVLSANIQHLAQNVRAKA